MATRTRLLLPNYCLSAASRTIDLGLSKEAKGLADRAKQVMDKTGENFNLTDYYRVMAKIAMHDGDATLSQNNLQLALDTARHQGAKLLELRCAIDLAELWQKDAKVDPARALLHSARNGVDDGDCIEEIARVEELISLC